MKYQPHIFTIEQKNNWRGVPLWAVVQMGNKSCPGVDFQGSSKSHIYRYFMEPMTGSPKPLMFEKLMDDAARMFRRSRQEEKSNLRELIKYSSKPQICFECDTPIQDNTGFCQKCEGGVK